MKGLAEWRATFTDYSITDSNIDKVDIITTITEFLGRIGGHDANDETSGFGPSADTCNGLWNGAER